MFKGYVIKFQIEKSDNKGCSFLSFMIIFNSYDEIHGTYLFVDL